MERSLCFAAALLFALGGLTGLPLGLAMTGDLPLDAAMVKGAHVNALVGCFWLIAVAWSMQFSRLHGTGRTWLARLVVLAAYANWLVTLVKSGPAVHGVGYLGEPVNDAVFGLLTVLVVLPTLAASGLWVWGLAGVRSSEPPATASG